MRPRRRAGRSEGTTLRSGTRGVLFDVIEALARPGHYYRGMTDDEFKSHLRTGHIKSTGAWSTPDEGTCFADNTCSAESYANFGRTDPRKTGKPTYLIEVPMGAARFVIDKRDGYPKTQDRVPLERVSRVWEMRAVGDDIVARPIKIERA